MTPLRWFISNFSTLLLAFALALVVWISAVTAADPNIERTRVVSLEIVGLDPDMLVVGTAPTQVRVVLEAPTSVMDSLNSSENAVIAWVDVAGLDPGTYELEVQTQINPTFQPVRSKQVIPEFVTLKLESLITRTFPVNLEINGEPSVGYLKGTPRFSPTSVTVSGAASLVSQIAEIRASLDISAAIETITRDLPLIALDSSGAPVSGVTISPPEINVTQPIILQYGYRNVIVRVVTEGQPANGYKLTNITVSPLNVVVFSSDPQLVNDLPGYVETEPIDLSGAEDDVDVYVGLNLPPGISIVGDPFVLVQVSIAAIESSLTFTVPVTPIGLLPTRAALIEPSTVDIILSGPLPILNELEPSDIRVVVDVTDLEVGTYQLELRVDILPERLQVESILPSTVLVEIIVAPTPTPTITPGPTPSGGSQP